MATQFMHKIIRPIVVPICIAACTAALIIGIGSAILALHEPGIKDRFGRPELWAALGASLVILLVGSLLAMRPMGSMPGLEKQVILGSKPFFETSGTVLAPVPVNARQGEKGTIADIGNGYTLFAQSGALATAIGLLPGGNDHGKTFAGYIYAKGRTSASSELWIPFEAVLDVYPQTKAAFLSIKGDETEVFGWNIPPESVRRGPARAEHSL